MSKRNWDDLAEAAKWARKKSRAMADVHWVGGNPEKLKVYGWAGWTGNSGFLVLRNPHKKVQNVTIDPIKVFELPSEYKGRKMALKCPFSRQRVKNITVQAGKKHRIKLRPFEVLVFNAR